MAYRGRVALITGAASGMGQLSAWRLAAEGVRVAAVDVDDSGLARTTSRAPMIRSFVCDVSDHDAVQHVVKEVEADLGPIDRVVNAAAIAPVGRLLDQPVDRIHRVMEVNYGGLVNVTKAALPGMIERRRGDLIQFGSLAGWLPSLHLGAYSATKAAVVSFSETLFHECAESGVRFTCVCPPVVDTPLLEQVSGADGPPGLADQPKLAPEVVLDAIEAALDEGRFLVFPGRGTTALWRARRLAPNLLWKQIVRAQRA